jgi:cobalt-zinc-cadmium efflux system outer membrane protein
MSTDGVRDTVRTATGLRLRLALAYALGAAVVLAGCALNRTADREVTGAIARYERQREQTAESYAHGARPQVRSAAGPSGPAEHDAVEAPGWRGGEPDSLRAYILLALAHNPDIRAAEELARAQAARVPQATALPDPMLMMRALPEPILTADGDSVFSLGLQQTLPVPEKLDRAGRIAVEETRMALAELSRVRQGVIADVKRTYFRIYIIDRTIEIDRLNQDLLRGLVDVVRAQVAAGRRRQDDVLRAQVELSNLESQIIELRQQRQTNVALLNRVLNRPPATPVPVLEEFDAGGVDVGLERLFAVAAARNPDLRRLHAQIERDRQGVKLARLAYWPDVTLGFEWMYMRPRAAMTPPPDPLTGMMPPVNRMSESGTDSWAVTLSMNLPVWSQRVEGGIRQARRRMLASQYEYVAAQNRVHFDIEGALARVRAQQELADIFRHTIIPQAQQAYEVSRAAYTTGESDFLVVIDNWQKWLTFTVQYHRALGELERSVADLEEAVGLSLAELGGAP